MDTGEAVVQIRPMNRRMLRRGWSRGWCLLLLGCGLPGLAAEPVAPDTLTPDRIARLRSVSEVAVSPEGGRVAYTLSVPRQPGVDDDGEPWLELWVLTVGAG